MSSKHTRSAALPSQRDVTAEPLQIPLRWEALEDAPRAAPWLIMACCVSVAGFLLARQWAASAVLSAAIVGLLVVDEAEPRYMTAELDTESLTLNGSTITLASYRAFHLGGSSDLILLPRGLVGLPVRVPVSGAPKTDALILDLLSQKLEWTDVPPSLLDRLLARLGL